MPIAEIGYPRLLGQNRDELLRPVLRVDQESLLVEKELSSTKHANGITGDVAGRGRSHNRALGAFGTAHRFEHLFGSCRKVPDSLPSRRILNRSHKSGRRGKQHKFSNTHSAERSSLSRGL